MMFHFPSTSDHRFKHVSPSNPSTSDHRFKHVSPSNPSTSAHRFKHVSPSKLIFKSGGVHFEKSPEAPPLPSTNLHEVKLDRSTTEVYLHPRVHLTQPATVRQVRRQDLVLNRVPWQRHKPPPKGCLPCCARCLFCDCWTQRRSASLLASDLVQLGWDHVCYLGLLLSAGLTWAWPIYWSEWIRYSMIFNIDIFDLAKTFSSSLGSGSGLHGAYTASSTLVVPIWAQMTLWGAVVLLVGLPLGVIWCVHGDKTYINQYMRTMYFLRRACLGIPFLVGLPFGAALGKLFHCSPIVTSGGSQSIAQTFDFEDGDGVTREWTMDTDNTQACFTSGIHWAYLLPVFILAVFIYIVPSVYCILKTRQLTTSLKQEMHEAYLLLKETEYNLGLHSGWLQFDFFIFSSFRHSSAHFRSANHLLKMFCVVFIYGAAFTHIVAQASLFSIFFFVQVVAYSVLRPYRVPHCTALLILSHVSLGFTSALGGFRALYTATEIPSTLLTPLYLTGLLAIFQLVWLVPFVVITCMACVRSRKCCGGRTKRRSKGDKERLINTSRKPSNSAVVFPRWPRLTEATLEGMEGHTGQYVRAVLEARATIDYCLSVPAFLAPVHELSRQILVINAFFREAEFVSDPLQNTLWETLDEVTSVHARLVGRSIFASSIKLSVRRTAARLLELQPALAHHLHQREFFLALASPLKQRILLKMFTVAVFMSKIKEIRQKALQRKANLKKVWTKKESQETDKQDFYYDDLYPERDQYLGDVIEGRFHRDVSFGPRHMQYEMKPLPQSLLHQLGVSASSGTDSETGEQKILRDPLFPLGGSSETNPFIFQMLKDESSECSEDDLNHQDSSV